MVYGAVVMWLPLALLSGACGGGGGDGAVDDGGEQVATEESTTTTGLQPCGEARHIVAFDWAGFLTASQDDWADWINGVAEPDPRPGGPEVVQAYRERGYEVLYVTTAPPNILIDGVPVPSAVEAWLERHGFPRDDGATVSGYTGRSEQPNAPVLSITDELLRLATEGAHLEAGYTENADKAYAFGSGGIPYERIYMLGDEAGVVGTTAIPDDDLAAHVGAIQQLPPVCTLG